MTVSVSASVGSNHKGRTFAQRERYVPQSDDGSTFTPAAWVAEGEPEEIAPGGSFNFGFGDGDGYSVKIWSEAVEDEAESGGESGAE